MSPSTRVLAIDDEPAIHRSSPRARRKRLRGPARRHRRRGAAPIAADAPDVIDADLGLPDIDGKDVIGRVREWSDVPIVLSAREREAEKIGALDRGADDFIHKPFGVGELMARLRAALATG